MSTLRINAQRMKELNVQLVLDAIRFGLAATRRELARQTGLTPAAVTILVNELVERGLLLETGTGLSAGGRKPVMLCLNPQAAYAIGVELTTTRIVCVLGDFMAAVVGRADEAIDVAWGHKRIIDKIIHLIEKVLKAASIAREKILSIGLAIPGPCDYQQGVMLNPPNFPGWINVPIKAILEYRTGFPVYTSKETSCAGLAEYWFGGAQGTQRIFALHVDPSGIGGAFILDGKTYQLPARETMYIGHMSVQSDGYACICGSRGCLEAHANSRAAIRYAQEYCRRHPQLPTNAGAALDYASFLQGVGQNDAACIEGIKKCAYYLSVALRNVIMLLAPQRVYYGGEFAQHCPLLMEKTIEYLGKFQYPKSSLMIPVLPFRFGSDAGAIGGLALAFANMFNADL